MELQIEGNGGRGRGEERGHGLCLGTLMHSHFTEKALSAPHKPRQPLPQSQTRTPISEHQHQRQHHLFFINFTSDAAFGCLTNCVLATLRNTCTPRADAGPLTARAAAFGMLQMFRSSCPASSLGVCGATAPEPHPFRGCSRPARRHRASSRHQHDANPNVNMPSFHNYTKP